MLLIAPLEVITVLNRVLGPIDAILIIALVKNIRTYRGAYMDTSHITINLYPHSKYEQGKPIIVITQNMITHIVTTEFMEVNEIDHRQTYTKISGKSKRTIYYKTTQKTEQLNALDKFIFYNAFDNIQNLLDLV